MKRFALSAALSLLLLSLLPGCWNRRELNTLAIQLGFGIDKMGSEYRLSTQVVEPGEIASSKGGSNRSPVVLQKSSAPTIFEAFRKLSTSSPRIMYAAHIRVLVIGEELARQGIKRTLDLILRGSELRSDCFVLIAKDTSAENVLKILTSLEKIPANHLHNTLDISSRYWSPTTAFTLAQLVETLVSEGVDPVLSGVVVKGSQQIGEKSANVAQIDPPSRLILSGLAVFDNDKLIGWLNETESRGYNSIMNNVKSTATRLKCPTEGYVVLEVLRSKTKVKGRIENGRPAVEVSSKNLARIAEVSCAIDITNTETIRRLQDQAEQIQIGLMSDVVETVQTKFSSDIFGFGEAIHRANPAYWNREKKNWKTLFRQLKITYKSEIQIKRTGMSGNSYIQDIKE